MRRTLCFILIVPFLFLSARGQGKGMGMNMKDSLFVDVYKFPVEPLSDAEKSAMKMAIEDEYKARNLYIHVMERFGQQRPFLNIKRSEEMHISMLKELYKKYKLEFPADTTDSIAKELALSFKDLTDACKAGVKAEEENVAMYDSLLKVVDNKDITAVFNVLRKASLERHLPAFKRCSEGLPTGRRKE